MRQILFSDFILFSDLELLYTLLNIGNKIITFKFNKLRG